jgi:hypothetical protein
MVPATTSFSAIVPNVAGSVSKISFVTKTAVSANDTDYWTFSVLNKTRTKTMVDGTAAANSTKATGGSAMVAYTKRDLTLSGTADDLVVAAGDVLEITITKAASATTMVQCAMRVDEGFSA